MPSAHQVIFSVAFEHAFFADGALRALRIVPVPACQHLMIQAGLLLRSQSDGVVALGDDAVVQRLRLHIDDAGGALALGFQVFFTDPHFFEYTAPEFPAGGVLFLDTAHCTADAAGRQMLHARPCVAAADCLARHHPDAARALGERLLPPAPPMVLQVTLSRGLLDAAPTGREFHVRFDAASSHWKYLLCGAGKVDGELAVVDPAGGIAFARFADVALTERERADVFLSTREIPMRQRSDARFQLRLRTAAGEKIVIKRLPHASPGSRIRERRDGGEILVSEIFINL
jgi:hypothetical protein